MPGVFSTVFTVINKERGRHSRPEDQVAGATKVEEEMDKVVIASTEADARAAEAVEQHHAQLSGALAARVEALLTAAAGRDDEGAQEVHILEIERVEREIAIELELVAVVVELLAYESTL